LSPLPSFRVLLLHFSISLSLPSSFSLARPPPLSTPFPYTTLFRSRFSTSSCWKYCKSRLVKPVFTLRICSSLRSCYWLPLDSMRSEEHTSELQSRFDLVCRHLPEKKKKKKETDKYEE